jgi:hypothetical protein
MAEHNQTTGQSIPQAAADDAAAEAAMRALFAGLDRPPMADERFTTAVMARVEVQAGWRRQIRMAVVVGAGSVAAALLAPHLGGGAADITSSFQATAALTPGIGAGAATLLAVALLGAAGWAMAERV